VTGLRAPAVTRVVRALTVAGSDSGGGAGIQADLKTFTAFRVYGASVLTAVTAQNSVGVHGVVNLPPEFVGRQLDAVLDDIGADAVKTGMLSTAPIIEVVAERLRAHQVTKLVVDPVMGGHLQGAPADLLFVGREVRRLTAPRIPTPHTHGTGCTYSAAIAAGLARGATVPEAVAEAKRYVTEAIRQGFALGRGVGP